MYLCVAHTITATAITLLSRSMDFIMGETEGSYYVSQLDCGPVYITPELAPAVGAAVVNSLARAVHPMEPGSVRFGSMR